MNTCKTLTLLCASIACDSCASATCRKDNKHRKLMYIESVDSEYRSIIRVHFITLINSMLCVSRIDIRFVQLKSTHFSIHFCPTFFSFTQNPAEHWTYINITYGLKCYSQQIHYINNNNRTFNFQCF